MLEILYKWFYLDRLHFGTTCHFIFVLGKLMLADGKLKIVIHQITIIRLGVNIVFRDLMQNKINSNFVIGSI